MLIVELFLSIVIAGSSDWVEWVKIVWSSGKVENILAVLDNNQLKAKVGEAKLSSLLWRRAHMLGDYSLRPHLLGTP